MEMKVGIGFNFIFNNTREEWHFWQHHAKKWMDDQVLHCLPRKFNSKPDYIPFPEDDNPDGMFFKFDKERMQLYIIVIADIG